MEGAEYADLEWFAESILGMSDTFLISSLSFVVVANDVMLTCIQFIDREAGLCGLYGGQVRPPGDEKVGKMITLFEKTMYERLAVHEAKAKM